MSTARDPAALDWVAGLPMPRAVADDGFRIELAAPADAPVQPFVSLCDTGRFSRLLLGRLCSAMAGTVHLLAIKLQRDTYRALSGVTAVDNREVDAMWQRERDYLRRLGQGAVPALMAEGPDEGLLPAMAYDRKARRLFRVASPVSWAPLRVCRDDALLRESGLEGFAGTTVRYVYSAEDPGQRTFHTWSLQDGAGAKAGIRVVRRHQLYRNMAAAWAALADVRKQELAAKLPDVAAALQDLPPDEVEQRIVPLCFYPAYALATVLQDVHFDEFCDLAGGASAAELAAVAQRAGPGRSTVFAALAPRLSATRQWLAVPWARGDQPAQLQGVGKARVQRLAVEAVFLKLQAFVQVCRHVQQYHAVLDRPHLGLASDNVMLRLAGTGAAPAPVRWRFEARLVDVGASHQLELNGTAARAQLPALFVPCADAVQAYLSPMADPATAPRELAVQAAAVPLLDGKERVGLMLELRSARERVLGVEPGDVVRVLPDGPLPGTGEQALLGQVSAVIKDGATVAVRLEPAQAAGLPGEAFTFAATASWHRRLQAPCDLFPLGMLLLRALLCHDERDVFVVREVWDRILDKVDMALGGNRAADPRRVEAVFSNMLDGEKANLGSESVLWSKALRQQVAEPLPAAAWRGLMMLAAKLLTARRGFSYAGHHGDVGTGNGDLLVPVLREAEELLARLWTELCEAGPRGDELAEITKELGAEVSAAMAGKETRT